MILSSAAFLTGANPGDFAIDPSTTTCVLSAGATVAAGHSCKVGVLFKPTAAGARTATLQLTDNTVNGINQILLDGAGTLPAPAIAITSPVSGSSVKAGTTVTFAVSVTTTATTKPTGTVTFKANGATIGSPVALSSTGTASITFSEPTVATYALSAVYSGDANYSTATASENLSVTALKAPVAIKFAQSANAALGCGTTSFSVHVSSTTGGVPTGTVKLQSGSSVLATAALTNGVATLSAKSLAPGTHTLIANYGGDSTHASAISSPVSLTIPPAGTPCGVQLPLARQVRVIRRTTGSAGELTHAE